MRVKKTDYMIIVGFIGICLMCVKSGFPLSSPRQTVQAAVQKVLGILQTYPAAGPAENIPKRRDAFRKIVADHFNFAETAKRTLVHHWKGQTLKKREEFVDLFYWRLYSFYTLRLEIYSDETVSYLGEEVEGNSAYVKTRIKSSKYPEFDVHYRLQQKEGKWRIYDIVVEGVSLIKNYRTQFNSFLLKNSFDDLLNRLREKAPDKNISD